MDPRTALMLALAGDRTAAADYNAWIQRGGFAARVAIDPATDLWMRGIRYAEVRWIGRKWLTLTEVTPRGRYQGKVSFATVADVLS